MIIFCLIIPLPAFLLDVLLIINISLSLIILMSTLFMREPLEFSIFPSLLLITTLFRLALGVSSTRLILLNSGFAGQVIRTFGEFVIRGDPVVGLVIFMIIVAIQFLVITKGSERVAEVAARFTLDAMPGKQMAIDADLNTGAITEAEARERRRVIQRESDFYGAMDGASKFVKGDAIMSIVVVVVNIVGGIVIGLVQGNMDFTTVLNTYIIATVGNGLVAQLPALMISTATGIIVTRAASDNNLAHDLSRQLITHPVTYIITGATMILMMIIPGFPWPILLVVGATLIASGIMLSRRGIPALAAAAPDLSEQPLMSEMDFFRDADNIYTLVNVEPIELEFGYILMPLFDENQGASISERLIILRKKFATEIGIVIPTISLRDNISIIPSRYLVKIRGEEIAGGEVLPGHYLVMGSADTGLDEIDGIDTIEPAFGLPAKWVSEENRNQAEIHGFAIVDPTSVIITHLSELFKKHAHEMLGRQEVNKLLDAVRKTHATLVDDVVGNIITLGQLERVLINLLKEQVPIRDMVTILETLGEYGTATKDLDMLTEYARQALKRTITRKYAEEGAVKVLSLDPELEAVIIDSIKRSEKGVYVALDPERMQNIINSLVEQNKKLSTILNSMIVLTSPGIRIYFKQLIEQFLPDIIVLSYSEIENNVQIQSFGVVRG